jgi:hypothetical protein
MWFLAIDMVIHLDTLRRAQETQYRAIFSGMHRRELSFAGFGTVPNESASRACLELSILRGLERSLPANLADYLISVSMFSEINLLAEKGVALTL